MDKFESLWTRLPQADNPIWTYTDQDNQLVREAVELLAAAMWHLGLVATIGGIESSTRDVFGKNVATYTPWQAWVSNQKGLSSSFEDEELVLRFKFEFANKSSIDVDLCRTLLSNMLIADGALRICGAWEVLQKVHRQKGCRCKTNDYNLHPVVIDRPHLRTWTKEFMRNPSEYESGNLRLNIVLMLSFRDEFMHGETADGPLDPIKTFREKHSRKFGMADYLDASVNFWNALVDYVQAESGQV